MVIDLEEKENSCKRYKYNSIVAFIIMKSMGRMFLLPSMFSYFAGYKIPTRQMPNPLFKLASCFSEQVKDLRTLGEKPKEMDISPVRCGLTCMCVIFGRAFMALFLKAKKFLDFMYSSPLSIFEFFCILKFAEVPIFSIFVIKVDVSLMDF